MADKKISQLPLGILNSGTVFPIVSSGITSQTTFGDIQNAIGGSGGADTYVTGGTYSTGTTTFTNNSGTTFDVTGFTIPNHYVTGFEDELQNGTSITIGISKGKIRLTNGSNEIIGIDTGSFLDLNTFGAPFYSYEMTVILPDGTRRYISLDDHIDETHGTFSGIYGNNQYNNYLTDIWTGATGDYEYYTYFIPEATGTWSYAEGYNSIASGNYSHAEGRQTEASYYCAHAQGYRTTASAQYSHAEGASTLASAQATHAEGYGTKASNYASHAEGYNSEATGYISHAEGQNTRATGQNSHAEGNNSQAIGDNSHAEGTYSQALGTYSHAEGGNTIASGQASHAEGLYTSAFGYASHTEGNYTQTTGNYSHAGGSYTIANGNASFVHGENSHANGEYSIVLGRAITGNTADTTYVDYFNIKRLGVGTSVKNLGIDANGNVVSGSALMKLEVGPAPSAPNDGDIWLESNTNTGLKIRIAGVTKTITLS